MLLLALTGCATREPASTRVSLAGAQVPVELTESWLQAANPARFAVQRVDPVYLSQHGFENLLRGECDIACTDRPITWREAEKFGERKVAGRRVAFYGYALYVNRANALDAVFSRHLHLIFQKRIKDWQELAGEQVAQCEGPIHLYGPEKSSRGGMTLCQLANIFFAEPTWEVLDSDAAIVAKVAEDPLGLGFASIGFEGEQVRYLGLRLERRADPSFPSVEEIESERYGLAKLVYVYYIDPPNPAVQAVLDYLYADAGRTAIEQTEMWAIPLARAAVPPPSR